jgi:hypothetical protein
MSLSMLSLDFDLVEGRMVGGKNGWGEEGLNRRGSAEVKIRLECEKRRRWESLARTGKWDVRHEASGSSSLHHFCQ